MKKNILFLTLIYSVLSSGCSFRGAPSGDATASQSSAKEGWVSLFNHRDLEGWTVKFKGYELGENVNNTFRVVDGLLSVVYDDWSNFENGAFGHLFTNQSYSNYRIRLEYRFIGQQLTQDPKFAWAFRNNGVMLHSQSAASMGLEQDFPISAEAQLLGGNGTTQRPSGNLCSPGTHIVQGDELLSQHCLQSNSATLHGDQWVKFEAEVRDDGSIKHFINGELVFAYSELQVDPQDSWGKAWLEQGHPLTLRQGHIALQAETHPTQFRGIQIKALD
jgi:hypothetical protein